MNNEYRFPVLRWVSLIEAIIHIATFYFLPFFSYLTLLCDKSVSQGLSQNYIKVNRRLTIYILYYRSNDICVYNDAIVH